MSLNDVLSALNETFHVTDDMNVLTYDILRLMTDPVARVLDVSQKMHELRGRLDQLDAERAGIQQEIAACMEQLALATGGQDKRPPATTLSAQILWALRQYPDHSLAPMDIAGMLNIRHPGELTNVRVLLSRMGRDGRARKVRHGRYTAIG